jgi:hypothetical protein
MKPASRKSNPPNPYLRPSQSLHSRFLRSHPLPARPTPQLPQLTLCILYKKRKIQFHLPSATPFAQVTEALYAHLHRYLAEDAQVPPEKAHRILRSIVGWESVDGDVNFDYRLSLQKGSLQQTKFLAPFGLRSQEGARFKIYHCLAIGGFSKVYLGRSYEDGQFYAIKFIRKSGEGAQEKY